MKKSITGIVPGIILIIIIIGIVIIAMNSNNSSKSSSNYVALKDYMSTDNINSILEIIRNCGITNYEIVRDDSLDTLDGENTIGFRLKSNNYNAVMYLKDNNIYSIRFADNDLYRNKTVLKKINEIK